MHISPNIKKASKLMSNKRKEKKTRNLPSIEILKYLGLIQALRIFRFLDF
jgi:hypothetical protein